MPPLQLDHQLLIPNYNVKSLINHFKQEWINKKEKKEDEAEPEEEAGGGDEQVAGVFGERPHSPSSSS